MCTKPVACWGYNNLTKQYFSFKWMSLKYLLPYWQIIQNVRIYSTNIFHGENSFTSIAITTPAVSIRMLKLKCICQVGKCSKMGHRKVWLLLFCEEDEELDIHLFWYYKEVAVFWIENVFLFVRISNCLLICLLTSVLCSESRWVLEAIVSG